MRGQGRLGESIELSPDPCTRLPGAREDGRRLQSGGLGGAGRARAQIGQRLEENKVAKKPVGAPHQRRRRDLPGWSRGMQAMGMGGLRAGRGGGLCAQTADPGAPWAPGLAASAARVGQARLQRPFPGPSRGDPPSLPPGAQPFLPPPGAARPRSPHLETLLHPQLLHGGGGGRAGGRARRGRAGARRSRSRRRGRGRPGSGLEPAPVAEAASGAREPGRGEGGGRAQSPPLPRRPAPHLAPLPWPAPLRPLGRLSPASPHPHPESASRALDTWGN